MQNKCLMQELEGLSRFFISPNNEEKIPAENLLTLKGTSSRPSTDECEVEETVTVRKRIVYPNTQDAQERIKRCLFKYLDENYVICRVDLKKTAEVDEPRSKKSTQEEICIFLKDAPSD